MKEYDKPIYQRMFILLRMALWHRKEDFSVFENMSFKQWNDLYNLCVAQGVLALAYDGLVLLSEDIEPDFDTKIQWAYNVGHIETVYRTQVEAAAKITDFFHKHGIKTMIMKGLSIARYYQTPSHRQFGDIDLYLMGDYLRGNELVREKGQKVRYEYFVHSEFKVKGVNVENHKTFVNAEVNNTGKYVEQELERLSSNAIPHSFIENAYAPSAEFDALFLTRHATWHYARECIRFRDLCDWALFLHHEADNMNTAEVVRMLKESGLDRYTAIVSRIARDYLALDKELPLNEPNEELVERVLTDILTFHNPDKYKKIGIVKVFAHKIKNRFNRKWCYDLVVPDSYWGNIRYSLKNYIQSPIKILKAKL